MKKIFFFTALMLLLQINVSAQDVSEQNTEINERTYWVSVDVGGGPNIFNENGYEDAGFYSFWDSWAFRAIMGYYVAPRVSCGFGFGFGYKLKINKRDDESILPLFFDFRYLPLKNLYTYADIGASINELIPPRAGCMSELGVGYRFQLRQRFAITFSTGYSLMSYWTENLSRPSAEILRWRHTAVIRLGLEI